MNKFYLLLFLFSFPAWAYSPQQRSLQADQTPNELKDVGITQRVGERIDLNLGFRDEAGRGVRLADYFNHGKPIILSLVYYSCPHLCNLHLNGLTDALKEMPWTLGKQFEAIAVSIDPKEDAQLAQAKKASHLKVYGRPEGASGWHFLTGAEDQIRQLAQQVGFAYRWDAAGAQWAHASAAIIVSPDGQISRYFPGIMFEPQSLRLSLVEAAKGKVGTFVDTLVMYCFQFDPAQNRYVFFAWNIMRLGAGLMALALGTWLAVYWYRQRKQNELIKGVSS